MLAQGGRDLAEAGASALSKAKSGEALGIKTKPTPPKSDTTTQVPSKPIPKDLIGLIESQLNPAARLKAEANLQAANDARSVENQALLKTAQNSPKVKVPSAIKKATAAGAIALSPISAVPAAADIGLAGRVGIHAVEDAAKAAAAKAAAKANITRTNEFKAGTNKVGEGAVENVGANTKDVGISNAGTKAEAPAAGTLKGAPAEGTASTAGATVNEATPGTTGAKVGIAGQTALGSKTSQIQSIDTEDVFTPSAASKGAPSTVVAPTPTGIGSSEQFSGTTSGLGGSEIGGLGKSNAGAPTVTDTGSTSVTTKDNAPSTTDTGKSDTSHTGKSDTSQSNVDNTNFSSVDQENMNLTNAKSNVTAPAEVVTTTLSGDVEPAPKVEEPAPKEEEPTPKPKGKFNFNFDTGHNSSFFTSSAIV